MVNCMREVPEMRDRSNIAIIDQVFCKECGASTFFIFIAEDTMTGEELTWLECLNCGNTFALEDYNGGGE